MTDGKERQLFGLLASFETTGELIDAARRVRDEGFTRWDCYTPFPVHGLDRAMGMRETRLPWVVMLGGVTGAGVAILMQWWMNAVDYKLIISGKPLFSLPAQIPIAFEVTVLFSALTAVMAMFAFNQLPQFSHPAFHSEKFRRVTCDGFFIAIEASDPKFDVERAEKLLRSLSGSEVEWLIDE